MKITIAREEGRVPVTILHVEGSVDASSYEELQSKAQEAIASGEHHLLIDLAQVPYMSSAGIRALNQIFKLLQPDSAESKQAMEQGLRDGTFKSPHLKLLNPTQHVLRVLQMAGLDMFIEIHHNLRDAVASF